MLGKGNEEAAMDALKTWPGMLQGGSRPMQCTDE